MKNKKNEDMNLITKIRFTLLNFTNAFDTLISGNIVLQYLVRFVVFAGIGYAIYNVLRFVI